jgi:Cd2+/Zn2+-exporting ATPase
LLVVASPCALVISTPASTLSALANAARQGILFKGGNHLEDAGAIRTVAFDKTGTLTVGHPALTDVVVLDPAWSEPEALRLAAAAERFSEHHLAAAVVRGAEARGLEIPAASGFRALAGKGVVASVAGRQIVVGNDMLFAELGAPVSDRARAEADRLRREGKTAVFVGAGGGPGDGLDGLGNGRGSLGGALGSPGAAGDALGAMRDGVPSSPGGMGDGAPGSDPGRGPGANGDALAVRALVAVADTLRPAAAGAVADLKRLGVERIVMLTGDNAIVARAIGDALGIADVRADLLPEEKLAIVAELKREGPVAMVGDGVNDAPALATASLGVAMGGAGTDVALETADVVLMGDDLSRLPYAIELGRKTRRVIVQNLGFALAVIAVLVASTLTVGIPLPLGVVGHEGSTVLVVLNGLRLLRPLGRVAGPPLPRS